MTEIPNATPAPAPATPPVAVDTPAPAAPPAAIDAPVPAAPPAAQGHWTAALGLPEGLQQSLASFGSPEEAQSAVQRALAYNPAKTPDEVKLSWGEGITPDATLEKAFKDFVVQEGIPAATAQKLIGFEQQVAAKLMEKQMATGEAELVSRFGADVSRVKQEAMAGFTFMDRLMEGRLATSSNMGMIMSDPNMVEALSILNKKLGEDSLGAAAAAPASAAPVSTEDFYKTKFPEGGK